MPRTMPLDGSTSFDVVLRNGRRVRIRPLTRDDRPHFVRGLARMSPRSRYLRFHAPVNGLTENQLAYLTEVDYVNHMAWVAVALDEPGEPGVAVARYIRAADDSTRAEAAVTVVDDYQGVGLGSMLMETLILTALNNGIDRLIGYILPENEAALGLFRRLGSRKPRLESGLMVAEIPVCCPHRGWRSSAAFVNRRGEFVA